MIVGNSINLFWLECPTKSAEHILTCHENITLFQNGDNILMAFKLIGPPKWLPSFLFMIPLHKIKVRNVLFMSMSKNQCLLQIISTLLILWLYVYFHFFFCTLKNAFFNVAFYLSL